MLYEHSPEVVLRSEAVRKLQRAGWKIDRQKGSHVMLVKPNYPYTLSIPQHKELGVGILQKIIKQADLTPEEFNDLQFDNQYLS